MGLTVTFDAPLVRPAFSVIMSASSARVVLGLMGQGAEGELAGRMSPSDFRAALAGVMGRDVLRESIRRQRLDGLLRDRGGFAKVVGWHVLALRRLVDAAERAGVEVIEWRCCRSASE